MRRCDAVLLVGDWWRSSKGTVAEVAEANKLGLPVFECLSEFVWGSDMYRAGYAVGVEQAKACLEKTAPPFPAGLTRRHRFEFDCGFDAGRYAQANEGQALVPDASD